MLNNGRLEDAANTIAKKCAKEARKEAKKEGYTKKGTYEYFTYLSDLLIDFEKEAFTEVDEDGEEDVAEMITDAVRNQKSVYDAYKKKDKLFIIIEKD